MSIKNILALCVLLVLTGALVLDLTDMLATEICLIVTGVCGAIWSPLIEIEKEK